MSIKFFTKKTAFLLISFYIFTHSYTYPQNNTLAQLYSCLLGSVDAKQEYQDQAHQALEHLSVDNPHAVLIKQMNPIGSYFAFMPLSSFTAFGIWLDQEYLNTCSEAERTFHVYHEAAHYSLSHHQKILAASASMLALTTALVIIANKLLNPAKLPSKNKLTVLAWLATLAGSYVGILPTVVKEQEKEADIQAACALLASDQAHVVIEQLRNLFSYMSVDERGTLWWYSPAEKFAYLKETLKNCA